MANFKKSRKNAAVYRGAKKCIHIFVQTELSSRLGAHTHGRHYCVDRVFKKSARQTGFCFIRQIAHPSF